MNNTIKTALALSGSLLLLVTAAGTASANYGGGYADGGPGPADTWAATHPSFGRVMGGGHATHTMHVHKRHSSARYSS